MITQQVGLPFSMSFGLSPFGTTSFGLKRSVVIQDITFFRASSDLVTTGWTGTTSPLANSINEVTLDRNTFITSPDLLVPITFNLSAQMPAGTYTLRFDAKRNQGAAEIRVVCLDSGNVVQGTSVWTALSPIDATYSLVITTTGVSTRFRIEVR